MYAVCRSHLCIVNVREYEVQDTFPLQFEGPSASNTTKIPREDTQRETKRAKMGAGEAPFALPFGAPP